MNGLCDDKDKELPKQFLIHFRGQLCLYAAALVFKKELSQNKNQWKDATKTANQQTPIIPIFLGICHFVFT